MISEKKKSAATKANEWLESAKACVEKVKSKRSKKTNQREFTRHIKENNFAFMADYVPFSELQHLLASSERPKDAKDEAYAELQQMAKEVNDLKTKISSYTKETMTDSIRRELFTELSKLKVASDDMRSHFLKRGS